MLPSLVDRLLLFKPDFTLRASRMPCIFTLQNKLVSHSCLLFLATLSSLLRDCCLLYCRVTVHREAKQIELYRIIVGFALDVDARVLQMNESCACQLEKLELEGDRRSELSVETDRRIRHGAFFRS